MMRIKNRERLIGFYLEQYYIAMSLRSAVRITLMDVGRTDNWSVLIKLASDKCSWYDVTVTYKGQEVDRQ